MGSGVGAGTIGFKVGAGTVGSGVGAGTIGSGVGAGTMGAGVGVMAAAGAGAWVGESVQEISETLKTE